ncbi:MAG TPA: hypothetical protein VFX47_03960 [Gammaproteobacteria bacterium]|nr:hypothetical protein [Gammaproteobacteria bacterium]
MKTESEAAVEKYFGAHGILIEKIAEGAAKSPDYRATIGGLEIIFEVKQFNATQEEEKQLGELAEGKALVLDHGPGKGVRKKISDGASQLSTLAKRRCPAVLILFNNRPFLLGNPASPYDVRVGMYGFETMVLIKPQGGNELAVRDRKFGGGRKLTEQHNTSMSGIAVMEPRGEEMSLWLYHNEHAAMPLPRGMFANFGVKEFALGSREAGKFQEWVAVDGS